MKKKLFTGRGGKILLAFNCLVLAILFWLVVRYMEIGELPTISSLFG